MIAVISGLVAVVLLVLVVVTMGMRSMNRRESALSPERIKAMAENKGPKPRRPAEDTFFESFPKDFDAFEEPTDRATAKQQRAAGPRPAPRPGGRQASRPAQRGRQPAAARGRRGVNEWGEQDDYDDDYWTRVRADEGGFDGAATGQPGAPRPAASPGPDAVTLHPSSPQHSGAPGLADLVEPLRATPSSALAEQKTMTFSAPAADALSALGVPAPASRPDPLLDRGTPMSTGPFASTPPSGPFSAPPPGDPLGTSRGSGSFEAVRGATPSGAPSTGPFDGVIPETGMFEAIRDTDPAPTAGLSTGPFADVIPETGMFEAIRDTGPAPTASPGPFEGAVPATGMFERPASYDIPPVDPYGPTGRFTSDTGPSYAVPPSPSVSPSASPSVPPSVDEPVWGQAPQTPAPPATPSWPGVRDVLDDPEPPHGYQPASYGGYDSYSPDQTTYPSSSSSSSYEVSTGWATIDDSDTVTGASPAAGLPTGPSHAIPPTSPTSPATPYDQGDYYGQDQQQGYPATPEPSAWPEQKPASGSWPSYDEMYGNTPEPSGRRGSHRTPESDYPDYYR
ncbi:hypothetical protein [Microtetraspora sp. NBRC 16547]|uniref:hypothetical protein n=1 Tax=Microtetraspora sp. NBRC 16547 TaxID=3030993 RepID=UPI0024A0C1A1|nr:hypothetical protein [Microtetraspora sp. NBRC 16547]GLW96560.1 hypothetical protein Misp02_06470 [Microtetraspora sp. NBRC 16547]